MFCTPNKRWPWLVFTSAPLPKVFKAFLCHCCTQLCCSEFQQKMAMTYMYHQTALGYSHVFVQDNRTPARYTQPLLYTTVVLHIHSEEQDWKVTWSMYMYVTTKLPWVTIRPLCTVLWYISQKGHQKCVHCSINCTQWANDLHLVHYPCELTHWLAIQCRRGIFDYLTIQILTFIKTAAQTNLYSSLCRKPRSDTHTQ